MKYCPQCGEKLEDQSIFCSCCGARQTPAGNVPGAEEVYEPAGETVLLDQTDSPFEAAQPEQGNVQQGYAQPQYAQQGYAQPQYAQPQYAQPGYVQQGYEGGEAALVKTKKKKTGLIIGICALAALLAAGALLFVTGAYAKLLPASKLKLGLAEKKLTSGLDGVFDDGLSILFDGLDFSFDADLNVEPYEDDGYYAETLAMLDELKLHGGVKTGEELKIGLRGEYKGNTAADVRLFADKSALGLYLSPASDDFYTGDIAKLLERFAPDIDASKLEILFKKLDRDGVEADTKAIVKIVSEVLAKADIDIKKNETIKLFGAEKVEGCAVYTVKLTEEDIEKLINGIADYLDSDECYIADYIDEFIQLADELGMDLDVGEPYADDPAPVHSMSDLTARMREKAPSAAASYVERGMLIEAVMKGSSIIRQRIYNDEAEVGYDSETNGDTTRSLAYGRSVDGSSAADFLLNATTKVNGSDIALDATLTTNGEVTAVMKGEFDVSERSAIGTYAGTYTVKAYDFYGDETVVKVDVSREGSGMMHRVDIGFDEELAYDNDIRSIKANVLVTEGSGVERPAGANVEDVSDYSEMKFYQLYYKLMNGIYSALGDILG